MRESKYQARLIAKLYDLFPGCVIEKADSGYRQGTLDLTIFWGSTWAKLEVKAHEGAPEQPNQGYYVDMFNAMSFAAFIYPENETEVLDALQQTFESCGHSRVSQR